LTSSCQFRIKFSASIWISFCETFNLIVFSGWIERCSIACFCQQTRSSKCNECCRNYWQVGSSLSETAPLVNILIINPLMCRIDGYQLWSKTLSSGSFRYIQSTCATSGEGLYEGLDWLSNNIANKVAIGFSSAFVCKCWFEKCLLNEKCKPLALWICFQKYKMQCASGVVYLSLAFFSLYRKNSI
jgi:hypothetical protein